MEEITDWRSPVADAQLFARGFRNLPRVLGMMGFKSLRPGGQDQIVNTLLAGVDSLCVMPTSAGKSACFVIPALCHDWRLLVFSPLKALMVDQVRSYSDKGIPAVSISSDNSPAVNNRNLAEWADGTVKIMFVAPERLSNPDFRRVLHQAPPDMVAVDEMHTLSSWTDSFRHHYVYIGDIIQEYRPRLVAGFTATYTLAIDADVRRVLRIPEARLLAFYPPRKNLHLSSSFRTEEEHDLYERIRATPGSVLIYCDAQKRVESLAQEVGSACGEHVGFYHAGVSPNVKAEMQRDFFRNSTRILVATNAFGMGIDKPDIRGVIHWDCPSDPEALSQEIGRAGRDGGDSWCHTFESDRAIRMSAARIKSNNPTPDLIKGFYDFMARRADSDNVVYLTPREIQAAMRISEYDYDPLIQLFLGHGVLQQADDLPRLSRVILRGKECPSQLFSTVRSGLAALATVDGRRKDGSLQFDMDQLVSFCGKSKDVLTKAFRGWQQDGILAYEPPPRAAPKRIVGDLKVIDLDRMREKRRLAFERLDTVKGYFRVDDSEKHDYLKEYFTRFTRDGAGAATEDPS